MKKGRWSKVRLAFVFFLIILVCAVLFSIIVNKKNSREAAEPEGLDLQTGETEQKTKETDIKKEDAGQKDKTENVYVKADASGVVQEVTVETVLKGERGNGEIQDYSTLWDIKNTEGDEEFIRKTDGILLWENHGEDIHYEGKSDQQIPVSVKISYYLDGKEMKPEQIAGQSGQVRIRFDYENHVMKNVEVERKDGEDRVQEQAEVYVPFAALTVVVLPSDIFSNIQVTNGKVITIGDQTVAAGYALPGFMDSLKLYEYKPAEDVEIPDYVEITADTEDFALDFTATVVTPGLFEDMDLENLDDADELVEAMKELREVSRELTDGTVELFDGAKTIRGYMDNYGEGVKAVDEGAQALSEGLKLLNDNKAALEEGALALQAGLEAMDEALKEVSIPDGDSEELAPVIAACSALVKDVELLAQAMGIFGQSLEQLQVFGRQAEAYAQAVQEAAAAAGVLSQSDLPAAITAANDTARQQAVEAVDRVLDQDLSANGIVLTEEQKQKLMQQLEQEIAKSIDVSDDFIQVKKRLDEVQSCLASIPEFTLPQLPEDTSQLMDVISDMQKQFTVLAGYTEDMSGIGDYLEAMEEALNQLKKGAHTLAKGSGQLTDGIAVFNEGIQQLYDGSAALSEGTGQLIEAGAALTEGADALTDGTRALAEGMEAFDEEGIQGLTKLAGEDLEHIIMRVRAMQKADSEYYNFGGIQDGKTGSVRFLIETEKISGTGS